MTEEKKRQRRPKAVILAEKMAWIAKHQWAGPKKALELVTHAQLDMEEAEAACEGKLLRNVDWKLLQKSLEGFAAAIEAAMPPEAR